MHELRGHVWLQWERSEVHGIKQLYLEGPGDLVSRLIIGLIRVTKSP